MHIVVIYALYGTETCMPFTINSHCCSYGNVCRQQTIELILQLVRYHFDECIEVNGHLSGMNPGIGAAGPRDSYRLLEQCFKRFFHCLLHTQGIRLPLPAVIACAIEAKVKAPSDRRSGSVVHIADNVVIRLDCRV